MNWKQVEGNWDELKAKAKQRWADLTDDDLEKIKGQRDELLAKLKERYGEAREKVEKQVDEWREAL